MTSGRTRPRAGRTAVACAVGLMTAAALLACGDGKTAPVQTRVAQAAPPRPPAAPTARLRVADGGETRGPDDAWVEIVEFSDFACAMCAHVARFVDEVASRHRDQVRLRFRHNPRPDNPDSVRAARAAVAAAADGRFWQMRQRLRDSPSFTPQTLRAHARALGLNASRFVAALAGKRAAHVITRDRALAAALGLQGTPHLFVNGRQLSGVVSRARLERVVAEELALAARLSPRVPRAQVWQTIMADARAPSPELALLPAQAQQQLPQQRSRVPVGDSVRQGDRAAPVTVVVFSDFQCPFSAAQALLLEQPLGSGPGAVQVVFKHLPLPGHADSVTAALAAEAARRWGKFWPMHDRLFANQQALTGPDLRRHARELGLDEAAFAAAMADARAREQVDADRALAAALGVQRSPTLFINGRRWTGLMPRQALERALGEELARRHRRACPPGAANCPQASGEKPQRS